MPGLDQDLIRASINLQETMDCRVKPGNDNSVDNSGNDKG